MKKHAQNTYDAINEATSALQALIDSYDGIKATYDSYKALKTNVEDLKNDTKYTFTGDEALSKFNSSLSTIDNDAEAATDAATLTDLLPRLKTAGNTFIANIESLDGFDPTYNVANNSFESGEMTPWTAGSGDTGVRPNSNGTYTTSGVDGDYLFNTWNSGAGTKVSQTISDLPTGYYTVTALVASDAGNSINILAGATTKAVEASTEGKSVFVEGTTDKTLVSDGSLVIGANSGSWYKADNFRLTFYTSTSGARDAWLAAKATAEAARDDADYTNVTGSEKTELLAEIAKAEPSTAEAYGTATTALQKKTSDFIAAKDSYDGLVAMCTTGGSYTTEAWPRASADKKTALDNAIAAVPTNAADAVTKTNAIVTAYRQFVESNGLAEGVDVAVDYTSTYLAGADPDVNSGWTNGIGVDRRDQEVYTKGDGTASGKYYDGGWSTSAAVNINMTRELTLPSGQYQLQITARGSANLTSYTMSIGGETVDLPKDGADAATGTFDHGWSDKFVVFNSDGTNPLTLAITATSTEYQQWISFNRLRLVKLDATLAATEDYEDLNSAIAGIEAKLGFENGDYAPYNNVEALAKLAEAKAIDQTANNVQEDVQNLTNYLNTASNWTANNGDVDAIYNGLFATVAEGQNYPEGWKRTNSWGQMQSGVSGNYATAYYNQPGSLQYGNQGVYTMPLAENTVYKLTFAYRSHENNSNSGVTASVLKGEEGLAATVFTGNGSTSDWKTVSKRFKTGAAGNYILTLANGGNTWMTGVSLVKEGSVNITIDQDESFDLEADPLANVTLKRSFNASGWNTFCVPFDISNTDLTAKFGSDVAVAEYDTENSEDPDNSDNVYINFTSMDTPAITANKPVLLKTSTTENSFVFTDCAIVADETTVEGTHFNFVGNYNIFDSENPLPDGNYFFSSNKLYKSTGKSTLKSTRAYIAPKNNGSSRVISFFIDNVETTSIDGITNDAAQDGKVYNLSGQQVNKVTKGIFVKNGKKYVVK